MFWALLFGIVIIVILSILANATYEHYDETNPLNMLFILLDGLAIIGYIIGILVLLLNYATKTPMNIRWF